MGRIDRLLPDMSLWEKIGQLNMAASFRAVTGPGTPHGPGAFAAALGLTIPQSLPLRADEVIQ